MLVRAFAILAVLGLVGWSAGEAVACGGKKSGKVAKTTSAKDATTVVLAIDGMTCGSCASKIARALKEVDGVHSAKVDLDAKRARVSYLPKKVSVAKIVATIEKLGFKVKPAKA
jgi:copper chaperone CopZ